MLGPIKTGFSSRDNLTFVISSSREESMSNPEKQSPPEKPAKEEECDREKMLDKTLADTFPASDPLSSDPDPQCEDPKNAA